MKSFQHQQRSNSWGGSKRFAFLWSNSKQRPTLTVFPFESDRTVADKSAIGVKTSTRVEARVWATRIKICEIRYTVKGEEKKSMSLWNTSLMKFWNTFVLWETLDWRHTSSRGWHPSPSLPVWEARNLKSKPARAERDLRVEISGSIVKVQCSGNTSRGTITGLRSTFFSLKYACPRLVYFMPMRQLTRYHMEEQTIPFFNIFFSFIHFLHSI